MTEGISISKEFLEKLLKPVNRLSESCVLKTDSDGLYTICSSSDNTVVLYARTKIPDMPETSVRLNLISVKKFLSGLDFLGDTGSFSMEYSSNNIVCYNKTDDGESTHFKYHLVDDSIIKECSYSVKKISKLDFDTEFIISNSKIKQIMSGYAFASDVTKIYFYEKDGSIYADINDKTLQNVDNVTLKISSLFQGNPIADAIPINTEVFKNLATCKSDVKVKINNQYKVFVFQNKDDNDVELKYIVPALVK
jgi:hypothetical protein